MTFRQKDNLTPRQKANRCLAMLLPGVGVTFGAALHRGETVGSLTFGTVGYGALFVGGYFILPKVAAAAQAARVRKAAAAQPAPHAAARPLVH